MDNKSYRITKCKSTGAVRCFELVNEEEGPEVAADLNFSEHLWVEDAQKCIAAETLKLVSVELQPTKIPTELQSMPLDALIVLRDYANQYDIITTAKQAMKNVEEAIERQRWGVINIYEAAALLSLHDGGHIQDYVPLLQDAAKDGHLELADDQKPMRGINTQAKAEFLKNNGLVHSGYITHFAVTTVAAINRCLDKVDTLGVIARLPEAAPTDKHDFWDAIYKQTEWEDILQATFTDARPDDTLKPLRVQEDGVWPSDCGVEVLDWHSHIELDEPVTHSPRHHPHLPFPFCARQLAAFMLDGLGYFVREAFGDWRYGPYEWVLAKMPQNASTAKHSVRSAFHAYREAIKKVGELDPSYEQNCLVCAAVLNAAQKAARDLLGLDGMAKSPEYAQAKIAMRKARSEADAAEAAWRKKMVQYLLLPTCNKTAVNDALNTRGVPQLLNPQQARQAARQETEQDGQTIAIATSETGLDTAQIASAFRFVEKLKAKLGDVNNHEWVLPARLTKGSAPTPATWCPLKLANILVSTNRASEQGMDEAFRQLSLREWRDKWQESRRERNAFGL